MLPRKRKHGVDVEGEPVDDNVEDKLKKPCLCKSQSRKRDRVSCFEPFRTNPLLQQLKAWRSSFRELHKLDQDRYVSQFCFKCFS